MARKVSAEGMTLPSRQIHVVRPARRVQSAELNAQTLGMRRLNASLRACLKESFKTFVAKGFDHVLVYRYAIQ